MLYSIHLTSTMFHQVVDGTENPGLRHDVVIYACFSFALIRRRKAMTTPVRYMKLDDDRESRMSP